MWSLLEPFAEIVLLVSSSYLGWRGLALLVRCSRARRAYPSPETSLAFVPSRDDADGGDAIDRCHGALLGLAAGDAVGLPAEMLPSWLTRWRYPSGPALRGGLVRWMRRAGDVSDDTQLAIAVARSIDLRGRYLPERFAGELRSWLSYRVAAGRGTVRAARLLPMSGHPARVPASGGEGNGAVVRSVPLALAHRGDTDPADLIADVDRCAAVTHRGPHALAAARLVALLVWEIARAPRGAYAGESEKIALAERCAARAGFDLRHVHAALAAPGDAAARLRVAGTSAHAARSTSAALVAWINGRGDLDLTLAAVFDAGGDVDSIGAIAGALVGAGGGLDAIPHRFRRVAHAGVIAALARRLTLDAPGCDRRRGEIVEVRGDIALRPVDVVVNAWNRNVIPAWLLLPQGVSRALRRAGGADAIREVSRRPPIPLGGALESGPGGLACRAVVHAAAIDLGWRASAASVGAAARAALGLARWLGARSVAVPLLGAGSGGLEPETARSVILAEARRAQAHFDRIEIVLPP